MRNDTESRAILYTEYFSLQQHHQLIYVLIVIINLELEHRFSRFQNPGDAP